MANKRQIPFIDDGQPLEGELVDLGSLPDLSPQQRGYVDARLQGKSVLDAYRASYNTKSTNDMATRANAIKVERQQAVTRWLNAARLMGVENAAATLEQHLNELNRLKYSAEMVGNLNAAVNAEISRGKAAGHYERFNSRDQQLRPVQDIVERLQVLAKDNPELAENLAFMAGIPTEALTDKPDQ